MSWSIMTPCGAAAAEVEAAERTLADTAASIGRAAFAFAATARSIGAASASARSTSTFRSRSGTDKTSLAGSAAADSASSSARDKRRLGSELELMIPPVLGLLVAWSLHEPSTTPATYCTYPTGRCQSSAQPRFGSPCPGARRSRREAPRVGDTRAAACTYAQDTRVDDRTDQALGRQRAIDGLEHVDDRSRKGIDDVDKVLNEADHDLKFRRERWEYVRQVREVRRDDNERLDHRGQQIGHHVQVGRIREQRLKQLWSEHEVE